MAKKELELHAVIHGHVQGVFFRAETRNYAQKLGLTGTVKNLPDGTVEIFAQGRREALERLLELLQGESGPGYVNSTHKAYSDPVRRFSDFRVLY